MIVNHFKSKGSGDPGPGDSANGAGRLNGDRDARRPRPWSTFADEFAAERGTDEVFLTGDFNSYTEEDPIQVLYDGGLHATSSRDDPGE